MKDPNLRDSDKVLYVVLHEHLDWHVARSVKQAVLARDLRHSPTRISRSIKNLLAGGYLVECQDYDCGDRRRKSYRLVMSAPSVATGSTAIRRAV